MAAKLAAEAPVLARSRRPGAVERKPLECVVRGSGARKPPPPPPPEPRRSPRRKRARDAEDDDADDVPLEEPRRSPRRKSARDADDAEDVSRVAPKKVADKKKKKKTKKKKPAKKKPASKEKASPETMRQWAALGRVRAARRWPDGAALGCGHGQPYLQPKYADLIKSGAKTWEGRAYAGWLENVSVDDSITFKVTTRNPSVPPRVPIIIRGSATTRHKHLVIRVSYCRGGGPGPPKGLGLLSRSGGGPRPWLRRPRPPGPRGRGPRGTLQLARRPCQRRAGPSRRLVRGRLPCLFRSCNNS